MSLQRFFHFLLPLSMGLTMERGLGGEVVYARNFTLDSVRDVTRLRIFSGKDTAVYALCPAEKCQGLGEGAVAIKIPLRRIIALANIHLGFLEALDRRSNLVGVDRSEFVFDSSLRVLGKSGQWKAVGSGSDLDWERATTSRPDAILISGLPEGDARVRAKARSLGIPILITGEWLESHPLGRAEWIKVYGALYGETARADSLFSNISHSYDSLRAMVLLGKSPRCFAFAGAGWKGSWHIAGGASFVAQLFRDAGIAYAWDGDTHTGSLTLSLESVLEKARDADLWLNPGSARSLSELERMEPRAATFKAFRSGMVFQSDAKILTNGANDYWENGPVRPDLILEDLIHIANDELNKKPGNYFRRLTPLPSPTTVGEGSGVRDLSR